PEGGTPTVRSAGRRSDPRHVHRRGSGRHAPFRIEQSQDEAKEIGVALMAWLRPSSRSRKMSAGIFFPAMVLQSAGFDQSGLLHGFLLSGIHDQRSLVSRLKGTAPLQEQVNGPAVLTGFDSDRGRHDGSLLEADIRPGTRSRIARGSKS